jgi:dihydrofolate reductase
LTTGKTVIMGRKTYESLPKRPLPNRKNIVITADPNKSSDDENLIYMNMSEVLEYLEQFRDSEEEVFVIGGMTVYSQLLPYVSKVYVTQLYHTFDYADTFFPRLKTTEWNCENLSDVLTFGNLVYQFQLYSRK